MTLIFTVVGPLPLVIHETLLSSCSLASLYSSTGNPSVPYWNPHLLVLESPSVRTGNPNNLYWNHRGRLCDAVESV